jgi:hypothetical protein
MFCRKHVFVACAAIALCALAAVWSDAATSAGRATYFTFNAPVVLPGIVLAPGTYIFEISNPNTSGDAVRILDRNRSKLYLNALTAAAERHTRDLKAEIVLGESGRSVPQRIEAWFAEGHTTGRRFLY